MFDGLSSWLVPVLAVGGLAVLTLALALFVGRWIDAQSNSVLDRPKMEDLPVKGRPTDDNL